MNFFLSFHLGVALGSSSFLFSFDLIGLNEDWVFVFVFLKTKAYFSQLSGKKKKQTMALCHFMENAV